MRFGRSGKDHIMRFGRSDPEQSEEKRKWVKVAKFQDVKPYLFQKLVLIYLGLLTFHENSNHGRENY